MSIYCLTRQRADKCRVVVGECFPARSHRARCGAAGIVLTLLPVKSHTSFTKCVWVRVPSQVLTHHTDTQIV